MILYRCTEAFRGRLTQLGGAGEAFQKRSILFQGTTPCCTLEPSLVYLGTCYFTMYFEVFLAVIRVRRVVKGAE